MVEGEDPVMGLGDPCDGGVHVCVHDGSEAQVYDTYANLRQLRVLYNVC